MREHDPQPPACDPRRAAYWAKRRKEEQRAAKIAAALSGKGRAA